MVRTIIDTPRDVRHSLNFRRPIAHGFSVAVIDASQMQSESIGAAVTWENSDPAFLPAPIAL